MKKCLVKNKIGLIQILHPFKQLFLYGKKDRGMHAAPQHKMRHWKDGNMQIHIAGIGFLKSELIGNTDIENAPIINVGCKTELCIIANIMALL